jgi:ribosomal protein S18 acetylase RimI-like enzyme
VTRNPVQLRPFTPDDLDFAAERTAAEGWDDGNRPEFEHFFAHDPAGCLTAEADGRRVGMAVATGYASAGFIGMLIVLPDLRGRGVGRRLLDATVSYLRGRGCRGIYLDSVPRAVPLYERAGFRRVCHSLRFWVEPATLPRSPIAAAATSTVRPMQETDLDAVATVDRAGFGEDRSLFLARRLAYHPSLSWVSERDGRVNGFVSGRRGFEMVTAGPLACEGDRDQAAALVQAVARSAGDRRLLIGVLESSAAGVDLLQSLGFVQGEDPPSRMVLGEDTGLGMAPRCLAIGSAAKG